MNFTRCSLIFWLLMSAYSLLSAQNGVISATQFLEANLTSFGGDNDTEWLVTDATESPNGMRNIYFTQMRRGILVENQMINIHLASDDQVIYSAGGFIGDIRGKIVNSESIDVYRAVQTAFEDIDLAYVAAQSEIFIGGASKARKLNYPDLALIPVEAKLIYVPISETEIRLTWAVDIYLQNGTHWWQFRVDAESANILQKKDGVITCNFGLPNANKHCEVAHHFHPQQAKRLIITPIAAPRTSTATTSTSTALMTPKYRVYTVGVESPSHGVRTLEDEQPDPIASPFGWHDTDGMSGGEYTITRGNNVLAQEDENGNNGTGYSPNAGAALIFDYPIDYTEQPTVNRDAAITNLFFWNNIMHDLAYNYGMTESTGSFQENNYGRGGIGGDYVFADALDGSGSNNATFGTPADGGNPRMTMFLWTGEAVLEINTPSTPEEVFYIRPASFGATTFDLTDDVALVNDGNGTSSDGCDVPFSNSGAVSGKIALMDRSVDCDYSTQALNAQNAGATGVIICNNTDNNSILTMGSGSNGGSVTIPAVMIGFRDCQRLKDALPSLNVSFTDEAIEVDGDYDNGIIAHEYGHGISNRLTGGPSTAGCLGGSEQMGEGWSDYMSLITTVQMGDAGDKIRGIGTYARREPTDGKGIRNFPYSTDMVINPVTYDDIKSFSVPHGVGSVWCSMLWDMYWDLVDDYGYDDDLYNGSGGNNIAINLVFHGMKMQVCNPGFIDGRDAILAADQAIYGGANQCTIWKAFARRGLGFSADQGSSSSRSDGTEAFDLPIECTCQVGTPCDDGDPCTINDVFVLNGENCDCEGTFVDADRDGFCLGEDPDDNDICVPSTAAAVCANPNCEIPIDEESFEAGFGIWNDGGIDCIRTDNPDNSYTGDFSIQLRNGRVLSPLFSNTLDLSAYDEVTVSFYALPKGMESGDQFFFDVSTNGGSTYTTIGTWNFGTDFTNDNIFDAELLIAGVTTTTVFRIRMGGNASNDQLFIDDVVIKGCSDVVCTPGTACDDGDDCTINDTFDNDCNCIGTFADSDNDGVCDADDVCPGFDDTMDSDNDGTPDGCDTDCQTSITFNNETISSGTYRSETTITSSGNVSIGVGETVIMEAAQSITLSPTFTAANGTTLTLRVGSDVCAPTANGIDNRSETIAQTVEVTDIYPNPTGDFAQFEFYLPTEETVQIQVLNLNGQVVDQFPTQVANEGWNRVQLPVSDLTNGIYLLQFQTGIVIKTMKFVVQR
ncbi:MAG: M36 family metallopeptidase [Bacteroidota bacterium]